MYQYTIKILNIVLMYNIYTVMSFVNLLNRSFIELADLITAIAAHIVKSPDINIHTHYVYARIQQLKIPAYRSVG